MPRVGWYCDHRDEQRGGGESSHVERTVVRGKWVNKVRATVSEAMTFGEGWPTRTRPPCPRAVPVYTKPRKKP
jgi:hypothetical protein